MPEDLETCKYCDKFETCDIIVHIKQWDRAHKFAVQSKSVVEWFGTASCNRFKVKAPVPNVIDK